MKHYLSWVLGIREAVHTHIEVVEELGLIVELLSDNLLADLQPREE